MDETATRLSIITVGYGCLPDRPLGATTVVRFMCGLGVRRVGVCGVQRDVICWWSGCGRDDKVLESMYFTEHAWAVIAAYLVTGAVIVAIIVHTIARARDMRARLSALEATVGPARRRLPAQPAVLSPEPASSSGTGNDSSGVGSQ